MREKQTKKKQTQKVSANMFSAAFHFYRHRQLMHFDNFQFYINNKKKNEYKKNILLLLLLFEFCSTSFDRETSLDKLDNGWMNNT